MEVVTPSVLRHNLNEAGENKFALTSYYRPRDFPHCQEPGASQMVWSWGCSGSRAAWTVGEEGDHRKGKSVHLPHFNHRWRHIVEGLVLFAKVRDCVRPLSHRSRGRTGAHTLLIRAQALVVDDIG